jgi:hypothetical protein
VIGQSGALGQDGARGMRQRGAMKTNPERLALAAGAACLFAAWALMPDAATNDAAHILQAVGAARPRVRASALIQLLAAALLVAGLLGLARAATPGLLPIAWGVLGMGADAVFHQLAYEMTGPAIDAAAVLPVMARMQTAELAPHVPLLLAFVLGGPWLGWRLRRAGRHDWASALLLAPLPTIPLAMAAVRLAGIPPRAAALLILGEICAGLFGLAVA